MLGNPHQDNQLGEPSGSDINIYLNIGTTPFPQVLTEVKGYLDVGFANINRKVELTFDRPEKLAAVVAESKAKYYSTGPSRYMSGYKFLTTYSANNISCEFSNLFQKNFPVLFLGSPFPVEEGIQEIEGNPSTLDIRSCLWAEIQMLQMPNAWFLQPLLFLLEENQKKFFSYPSNFDFVGFKQALLQYADEMVDVENEYLSREIPELNNSAKAVGSDVVYKTIEDVVKNAHALDYVSASRAEKIDEVEERRQALITLKQQVQNYPKITITIRDLDDYLAKIGILVMDASYDSTRTVKDCTVYRFTGGTPLDRDPTFYRLWFSDGSIIIPFTMCDL
jgi:hypothetical protein